MDPLLIGAISFIIVLLLMSLGVHIATTLLIVGLGGLLFTGDLNLLETCFPNVAFSTVTLATLTVVPMFLLMGALAAETGMVKNAYDIAYKWFGRLPGGLAIAATAACGMFGAVCGSSIATAVAIGRASLPELDKYNYERKLSLGCFAASGTIGALIPPSIVAVIYASTVEVSVGKQLLAGLFPGVLTAILYIIMIFIRCKINPKLGRAAPPVSWRESFISIRGIGPIAILFLIILGGIYTGFSTPTEAGALACLATIIIAVSRKELSPKALRSSFVDTIKTTSMILFIAVGATMFTYFLTRENFGIRIASIITSWNLPPIMIIIAFLAMYIPLGMFLETFGMILITLPIIYPIVQSLGFDGIWFGVLVVKMIEVGMITPPVGFNVFVISGIAPDTPLEDIFVGVAWFFIMDLVVLALLVAFPQISLWLPDMMFGS